MKIQCEPNGLAKIPATAQVVRIYAIRLVFRLPLTSSIEKQLLRRSGAWLALFAVALQLCLSLGHLHPEDVWGSLGHAIVQGHGAVQLTTAERAPAPLGDQDHPAIEAACQICAAAHMAAHGALPQPITFSAPTVIGSIVRWAEAVFLLTAAPFLFSQSRGPPLS